MLESKLGGKVRKQLGDVCMKVLVQHKGRGGNTEGVVYTAKNRTENGGSGNTTRGCMQGQESVIKSDMEGA